MEIRKTRQRLKTLEALAGLGVSHGFEIASTANLKPGTVYGVLATFEEAGFVESRWEPEDDPKGRPRRRLYRLTPEGVELLQAYRAHFAAAASPGLIATISNELHAAIDQVWGGMFQYGVKVEKERQLKALEEYRKHRKPAD
ncbi:MAG: PadR family transcriptional regulator [Pseudomonadales bacterium]|nr:PadR family transcriptional regulator [Pseudomonadales bacterium]